MGNENGKLQLRKTLFGIKMSVRDHSARLAFFDKCARNFKIVSVLSSTAVVVTLLGSLPTFISVAAGLILALFSAIDLVAQPEIKARRHEKLRNDFMALEGDVGERLALDAEISSSEAQEFTRCRLAIEEDEPPTLTWLTLHSRNQQIISQKGVDAPELVKIPTLQKWFINFGDMFDYRSARS